MYYVFCLALSNVIFPRITGDTVERVFTPNGGLDNQVIGIKTFFCSIILNARVLTHLLVTLMTRLLPPLETLPTDFITFRGKIEMLPHLIRLVVGRKLHFL